MLRCLLRIGLALILVLSAVAGPAGAQEAKETIPELLDRWESEARETERRFEFNPPSTPEIEPLLQRIGAQLARMPDIRSQITTAQTPIAEQRNALGDPPEDPATEAPQIAQERQRLDREMALFDTYARRLDQAEARARGIESQLIQLRSERFTEELITRGPSLLDPGLPKRALEAIGRTAGTIALETSARWNQLDWQPQTIGRIALPLVLLLAGIMVLLRLKDWLIRILLAAITGEPSRSRLVALGVGLTLARLLLPIGALVLVFSGIFLSGLLGPRGELLLRGIGAGVLLVTGAYALGGAFFAPDAPRLRISVLDDENARRAHFWLIMLAGAVGLDRALIFRSEGLNVALEGLTLINVVLLTLGGIALWVFARYVGPIKAGAKTPPVQTAPVDEDEEGAAGASSTKLTSYAIKALLRVAAVASPILAALGYYAASRYAFFPVVFSCGVIGICILLFYVVQSIVRGLGIDGEDASPALKRLKLIPILLAVLLACGAAPVLALIWGLSIADLQAVWRRVLEGFAIGDVVISPVDFFVFLGLLIAGLFLTSRLKRVLKRVVLPAAGLDTGGRDAIAAGAGYIGLVVTVLVAISATGIDLSNLAIVAGALSVGIGFGLQNIVNNFVSGIILLVERPIKAGDWIELPSGMGYVKTVNVRSTEVETFDRSSLFVPNSQLISENLINWTHNNLHGRIICKVGVAYDTDPRRVERILLDIARAHPLMLRRPAPYVLFRAFGPDSLDFEIRGILRDVNWILNVQSDINFEIMRCFKEEGIQIPFRQADIEIKNLDRLTDALVDRVPAAPPPRGGTEGQFARAPRHSEAAGKPDAGDSGGDGDAH